MALVDRITLDTSGMNADKLTALAKGIAWKHEIKDVDGSLDISDTANLKILFRQYCADMVAKWVISAEKYEDVLSASYTDISDA